MPSLLFFSHSQQVASLMIDVVDLITAADMGRHDKTSIKNQITIKVENLNYMSSILVSPKVRFLVVPAMRKAIDHIELSPDDNDRVASRIDVLTSIGSLTAKRPSFLGGSIVAYQFMSQEVERFPEPENLITAKHIEILTNTANELQKITDRKNESEVVILSTFYSSIEVLKKHIRYSMYPVSKIEYEAEYRSLTKEVRGEIQTLIAKSV